MKTVAVFVPSSGHVFPGHPEEPGRLNQVVIQRDGVEWLSPIPANAEEVTRVHTPELLDTLKLVCQQEPGVIDYAPTYVTETSYNDALLAAGGTLACTRQVMSGNASNAFAIVRPPGHHAEPERAMGFCIFNNIAIAAQDAIAQGAKRVLVIDYDAHHGNGTQAYAWKNERVAFLSTHEENIYPGSGAVNDAPHARKRIVNVPLPAHTGMVGFSYVTTNLIIPFVHAFAPDLLLVSAGFDAHWNDPLASLGMTTSGFYNISRRLVELAAEVCGGRIVFVLEGGYHARSVSRGIDAVFAALGSQPAGEGIETAALAPYREPDVQARVDAIRKWHGF